MRPKQPWPKRVAKQNSDGHPYTDKPIVSGFGARSQLAHPDADLNTLTKSAVVYFLPFRGINADIRHSSGV